MTIRQVLVPYQKGYNIGVGANLATGSPMAKVVDGPATKVAGAGAATVTFRVSRIQTTEDLEAALGIDAEASYGCAAFGAGVSARFSFVKNTKVQAASLFMLVTADVELAFESIDEPVLTQPADDLLQSPAQFEERYGNVFVRGVQRGGFFVGTLRIDTSSAEQSTQISGELAGSYALFSADVKSTFGQIQHKYNCSVYVDMYHEGGPVDLTISDPTDPKQLLDNANLFLRSFRDMPEEQVAKPYLVTLAPIGLARSTHQLLNQADVEHAQDVLVACAKARSRILDKLNLLEYLLANPSKYTFQPGVDPAALTDVQAKFEKDLDLVAACASAAINAPGDAKMPADFAAARGASFQGVLPQHMPTPVAGKMTEVPDFSRCTSWTNCVELATSKGLVVHQVFADEPPDTFHVLTVSPPAGTPVPEGESIQVVTRRAKSLGWTPIKNATSASVARLGAISAQPK